jgi:hypothetical protein
MTIFGADAPVHRDIFSLLPWYVNGTIEAGDRQRVDEHLARCAQCSEEFAQERSVYEHMTADNPVEYMPAASLQRLQARLQGENAAQPLTSDAAPAARPSRNSPIPWRGLMAASVAVLAVAVSLLAAGRWTHYGAGAGAPVYHTVTISNVRAPNEAVRAVFAPTITLNSLQDILNEAQLRIVSGPTEAGVYSLAPVSDRPVSDSLAILRKHAEVRFAETTGSTRRSAGVNDPP